MATKKQAFKPFEKSPKTAPGKTVAKKFGKDVTTSKPTGAKKALPAFMQGGKKC